jgi:hypothetical protein
MEGTKSKWTIQTLTKHGRFHCKKSPSVPLPPLKYFHTRLSPSWHSDLNDFRHNVALDLLDNALPVPYFLLGGPRLRSCVPVVVHICEYSLVLAASRSSVYFSDYSCSVVDRHPLADPTPNFTHVKKICKKFNLHSPQQTTLVIFLVDL